LSNPSLFSETSGRSAPQNPPKMYHDNYRAPFKEFLRSFKESSIDKGCKYSSVSTKMMAKQFNVFHLYFNDVRKFNSNLGWFSAAEYVKHDGELSSIVKEYIEELKLEEPKNGVIVIK
jgi:hypothetical protein